MGISSSSAVRTLTLVAAVALFVPGSALAVEHQVDILLDLDENAATGCTVATVDGPFDGVEQILVTTVDTTSPPPAGTVTDVAIRDCTDPGTDTFGTPASFDGGWPIGVDNGVGGRDVVETYFPLLSSVVADPGVIRLGVVVTDELGGEQALLTVDDDPAGAPIVIDLRSVVEIPTLGEWGLILLALTLAAASVLLLGRRGTVAFGAALLLLATGTAWAAGGLDGLTGDWSASDQLASNGIVFFGKAAGGDLCFRVDVDLLFNTSPTADPQAVSTDEETPVAITLTGSDPESDPLTFTIVSGPTHGTLSGAPPNVTYTPDPDYEGPDSFEFQVEDPSAATDTATVTITVNGVNDAPVVDAAMFSIAEDEPVGTIVGTVTFTDPDAGQSHTFAITTGNTGGAFAIDATTGVITVAAALDFETLAAYSLTVEVTDDGAPVLSGTATVDIAVTDADDAPAAVDDAATVAEDSGANAIDVLANDTDVDGGPISIQSVTQPTNGTVVITNAGADLTYEPDPDACNDGTPTDDFTYTLNGGSTATVSVTVTCVDDDPVAVDDAATVTEDDPATAVDVLANDTDVDGGPISVDSVTQPANGTVVITGGGTGLTYQPDGDYCNAPPGTTLDTFTYTLAPGGSTASVTVTVTCEDDAPTAVADAATVAEDSGANAVDVLANDTDIDGGPISVTSVTQPGNGTVAITGGGTGVSYTPNANYCNSPPGTTLDTFTYTLAPGGSSTTVTVTVTCADDPPVAVADAATVAEDSGANAIDVLANDTDVDGGPILVFSVTQPANGAVAITGGGTGVTYAPNANYCNTPPGTTLDTFTYTLSPGGSSTTVTVSVTCVNDGPTIDLDADDDKGTGGNDFAATFTEAAGAALIVDPDDPTGAIVTDVDSATLDTVTVTITNLLDAGEETLSADVTGTSIVAAYVPATGVLTLTGPDTLANFTTVLRTVRYENSSEDPDTTQRIVHFVGNDGISDGNTAVSTVTVVAVDTDPTAVDDAATVVEDSGANAIDVLANDTDPDAGPISVTSVTQPANGAVAITGGGTGVSYTPDADYCNDGTPVDGFSYTLAPGGSTATVSVTVTCADDAPTAVADAATVVEDSGANAIDVLANDTDPDGGPISVTSVTQPANGAVSITGGGTGVSYTPNANYCNDPPGTTLDTFTYTLTPGGSSTTVTVTVTCVDDDPVAVADAATVVEDSGANAIDVLANDTDVDGGSISVTSVTQPANGAVSITGGGTGVSYTPNANYCNDGSPLDTFNYTLTPGGSSTTVSVTVTCVDDPPVAVADAASVVEDSGANAVDVLANDTDIDGGPISVTSVTQPANGAVSITGGGTGVSYTPDSNYCNDGSPLDTFTYTLSPGGSSTTVSMTVTCVNDPPVAGADSFDFIGNTELRVDQGATATPHALETTGSGFGALHNDSDPVEGDSFSVTSITVGACTDNVGPTFDCTDPAVGTVHMDADGSFSFEPAPGDAGAMESFTYTITDDGTPTPASATGTVTLNRAERVWYVDNSASPGGDGTSDQPFHAITAANLNDNDSDGDLTDDVDGPDDYIFVHFGLGTDANLSGGLFLEGGQHLIGEHAGLSLPVNLNANGSPTLLVAAAPGSRPMLDDNVADGFDGVVARNVVPAEIVGMNLAGDVNAVDWTTTAAFAGTGAFSIRDNVIRSAGTEGVDINLAGTGATSLAFHDNNLTATGTALDLQESGSGTVTITRFDDNVVSGNTGGHGIAVNGAIFDAVPGGAFDLVSGGTTAIGASGNGVGFSGLLMTGVSGDLQFTDLDVFADNGTGLQVGGTGPSNLAGATGMRFRVGAGVGIVTATAGPAVYLSNVTADLQLSSLTSSSTSSIGVNLDGVSDGGGTNAVFSAGSGSSITTTAGASGPAFRVNGGNARITYPGTITNNSSSARAVSITSWAGDDAGDDLLLSGAIDENGAGILLNGNGGSRAITFSGGLDIDTTTGEGFAATSNTNALGLNVTGSGNTIDTVSATGLRVTSTPIGSGNLNFQRISSGNNTAAADPANGIVVSNTGSLGRLVVTGTGGAGTGGTIQSTTGTGIALTNTANASFSHMQISNTGSHGLSGSGMVDGTGGGTPTLSILNSRFTSPGDGDNESAMYFGNTAVPGNNAGRIVVADTVVEQFEESGFELVNSSGSLTIDITGSPSGLTDSTTKFDDNNDTHGQHAITVVAQGTASIDLNVTGVYMNNIEAEGVVVQSTAATSSVNVDLLNNVSINGGGPDNFPSGGGIALIQNAGGSMTFDVQGNNIRDLQGDGVVVIADGPSEGRIGGSGAGEGNVISGSLVGDGIRIDTDQLPGNGNNFTATILIQGNNIGNDATFPGIGDDGIQILNRDGTKTLNLTIENNQIANTGSEAIRYFTDADTSDGALRPSNAVRVAGNTFSAIGVSDATYYVTQDTAQMCLHMSGNTFVGANHNISVNQQGSSQFQITQASVAGLAAANTGSTASSTGTINTGGTCTNPPLPTNP